MKRLSVLLVAALSGYISLGQIIAWVRLANNANENRPTVFAFVLGFFLLGLACGALGVQRASQARSGDAPKRLAVLLLLAAAILYLAPPLIAWTLTLSATYGLRLLYMGTAGSALFMGAVLPWLGRWGRDGDPSAESAPMAVYLVWIAGATVGPLLTSFILLDLYSIEHNMLLLAGLALLLTQIVLFDAPISTVPKTLAYVALFSSLGLMFSAHGTLYTSFIDKFHDRENYSPRYPYKYLLQNRTGIIGTGNSGILYNNGIYDGRFNTDPVKDVNMISRAYMLAALHPRPQKVLMIGLGSASWARVIANHQRVKELDIVEVNPGYLQIIRHYPQTASILDDPKARIHLDDGRRWLRRHPHRRFDAILINASFNWRGHSSHLLSQEMMQLCRLHLEEGGVLYFNATDSEDAAYTAAQTYRHVARYLNCIAASDRPFAMGPAERRRNLKLFSWGGITTLDERARGVLDRLAGANLADRSDELSRRHGLQLVTDDNMATEFKSQGPGLW
jgi:spermidine synthase